MRRVSWVVAWVLALACTSCGGTRQDARPRDRVDAAGSRTPAPSDAASPGRDPSPSVTFPALTAEQIRHHPDATSSSGDDFPATASGVAVRIWSVCLDDCTRATERVPGELQTALEVSRDDFATGAL